MLFPWIRKQPVSRPSFASISQGNSFPVFFVYLGSILSERFSLGTIFRSVPSASLGYQKHLLSLKVMTSQTEQGLWSFTGGFGRHGSQWVKLKT